MAISPALIKEFENIVDKANVITEEADRQAYSYDAAVLKPVVPALVVAPTTQEELGKVVKLAYDNGMPITVRGSWTNLCGASIPEPGDGIVLLTNRLHKTPEINAKDP